MTREKEATNSTASGTAVSEREQENSLRTTCHCCVNITIDTNPLFWETSRLEITV